MKRSPMHNPHSTRQHNARLTCSSDDETSLKAIKNAEGKMVCQVDPARKAIVIVHKGQKTVIKFLTDGTLQVTNTQVS